MTTAQVNQLLVDFDAITANTGTNKTMVGTGNAALSVGPPNGSAARTQMLTEGWTTITVS
jgi:hypothetical protein